MPWNGCTIGYFQILFILKGILTDVKLRAPSKISKIEFFEPTVFVAFLQEVHFLRGIWQNFFSYETRVRELI